MGFDGPPADREIVIAQWIPNGQPGGPMVHQQSASR
jgi:hypothetical protein